MSIFLACEDSSQTPFMSDFLCNLKGRVILSFGMLLMCSGNDCPTAPRLFAQHYSRGLEACHTPSSLLSTTKAAYKKIYFLKKQSDYPQHVIRVWMMYREDL